MKLRPEALSPDGFIIDQRKTDNISFGGVTSDKNGCGWIACCNLLRALGRDPDPEEIVRRLEKTLLFHGYLGLHLFALVWELRRNQHIPLNFAVRPFHAQQLCETAPAGIILYRSGRWNHFAAFRRDGQGGVLLGRRFLCRGFVRGLRVRRGLLGRDLARPEDPVGRYIQPVGQGDHQGQTQGDAPLYRFLVLIAHPFSSLLSAAVSRGSARPDGGAAGVRRAGRRLRHLRPTCCATSDSPQ